MLFIGGQRSQSGRPLRSHSLTDLQQSAVNHGSGNRARPPDHSRPEHGRRHPGDQDGPQPASPRLQNDDLEPAQCRVNSSPSSSLLTNNNEPVQKNKKTKNNSFWRTVRISSGLCEMVCLIVCICVMMIIWDPLCY